MTFALRLHITTREKLVSNEAWHPPRTPFPCMTMHECVHKTSEGFWHVWHMCLAIIMAPLSLVCCSWNSGGGVPIFLDYWDGLIKGSGHFSHLYLLCIPLTVKSTLRCSPLCPLPMIVLYSVTSHVNLCFLCFPRFSTLRMDPPFNVHTKRCITMHDM